VEVRPTGPLWIDATADGERVLFRLLQPDEPVTIEAKKEIVLRVGDAGALEYSINGRAGRRLGGPGQVRTIRLTPDDYPRFLQAAVG
jgi:hypothetical protein